MQKREAGTHKEEGEKKYVTKLHKDGNAIQKKIVEWATEKKNKTKENKLGE